MNKLNRRDYLIRMGTSAAGILGAANADLFAQKKTSRRSAKRPQKRTAVKSRATTGILQWPITNTPPNRNSFVTAIFWGLMGFCYNTEHETLPVCEVGFHPGGGHHRLEIKIYRSPGCNPIPLNIPSRIDSMRLQIIGGSGGTPDFYQTTDYPFDRYKIGGNNDYDFRWLPDLDSADFYPENYSKNNRYNSRLFVSNGTFYTRVRTGSKFKLVDAKSDLDLRPFGYVARFMAATLDVQGNDFVRFQINSQPPLDLRQSGGVTYQIVFKNECSSCSFDPADPHDETRRNDFHFNRKVVKVPGGRTKYSLKIDNGARSSSDFCETSAALNDEAPCMGSGYGQTPKFP